MSDQTAHLEPVADIDHARILSKLDGLNTVTAHMREKQASHGEMINGLARDSERTATGMVRLVAIQEAKESREVAALQREADREARAEERAAQTSDRWFTLIKENWKYIAAILAVAAGPESVRQIAQLMVQP